jgi:branched-chain amino acid transport system substrate-binding protein
MRKRAVDEDRRTMKTDRWGAVLLLAAIGLVVTCTKAQIALPATPAGNAEVPYANMPPAARPFANYRNPYQEWYVQPDTLDYGGSARNQPDGDVASLKAINVGFLGPLDADNEDSVYGIAMLHGAQLAFDEANASGGFYGKPFALKIYDDLALWGASSMAIVDMRFKDQAWAMLGSVDSASTHVELRATLKLELPIMDTATNDPTVTQTLVPWLLHNFPDDRQQGYALADYIFLQRHLKRIGVLQVNNRYGRAGKEIFSATARRIGRQPVVEVWFAPDTTDFTAQLQTINASGVDGLVIWANAPEAGLILKQMRALGMRQPVFGSSRICSADLIKSAGSASEGLTVISAIDPTRSDPTWIAFQQRFVKRFGLEPDAYAAYAYDGANMLLGAINHAGLNRGRIMDALRDYQMKPYAGVSGRAFFDYTLNNIAPVTFAQVRDGKFIYWPERRTDWKPNDATNAR